VRRTSPYTLTVEPVIHFCRKTGLPAMALRRHSAIAGNPVFLQRKLEAKAKAAAVTYQ